MSKLINYGWIWILIAASLWALDGFLRRSLYVLSPYNIVFYEHLVGFLILMMILRRKLFTVKFSRKELFGILIVSLVSGLLGTLWFTEALVKVNYISISVVFLIQKLQPVFAISSARILLNEKINDKFVLWAGLALIAGFYVTFPMGFINWDTGSETVIAGLFALGAAVAWGGGTTLSRMVLISKPYEVVAGWRFMLTMIFTLILILITGKELVLPSADQWQTFVVIAISTGMLALVFYYKGLKTTKVQVSTIIELVFPLLVILLDALVNKTVLHYSQYLATLVLLFAVYNIVKKNEV